MLVVASYNLLAYTFFVLDAETRFTMGYSFVLTITVVLSVNLIKLFYGMLGKYILTGKQRIVQIAYERRFYDHAKIERLSYILHLNRQTKENQDRIVEYYTSAFSAPPKHAQRTKKFGKKRMPLFDYSLPIEPI